MTDELCEVIITAPDAGWLVESARRLVDDHVAASAHSLPEIRSVYRWRDEVVSRTEARAAVRTRTRLVPTISGRLDNEHPYEVPGIVVVPIIANSPANASWLLAQTEPAASGAEPGRQ